MLKSKILIIQEHFLYDEKMLKQKCSQFIF